MNPSTLDGVEQRAMLAWMPPEKLSLSEWADRHFVMSPENSASPGKWRTLPYQREIMDAITDPRVEAVTLMKSGRVGYTLMMTAGVGYYIEHDPSSQLVVQPTVEDAKNYSKETIAAMLRDVPALSRIIFRDLEERGPKDPSATLTHKAYPGGVLSLIGANSGAGFRRIGRRVVWFDETDAYPPSAGVEGDQIRLGIMRTQTYWNRKIVMGSTPLIAGTSRIADRFAEGDRRRYYVPCPNCGAMDFLVFRKGDRGHYMAWPTNEPRRAHFVCSANGCAIEHRDKRSMVAAGEWRAGAPFRGHASFHIWAAYSFSANATWGQLAEEFLQANAKGPAVLQTFVNTALGEVWHEKGEAPDWKRLYDRRETYERGTVPKGVLFLTMGVDVQRDRLVWEIVGWAGDRQSWSIDADVIAGDTAGPKPWAELDVLLARTWPREDGQGLAVGVLAVDSGDQTQVVYNWARGYPMSRVIAVKGVAHGDSILGAPRPVDLTYGGRRTPRGYKVWPVDGGKAKTELYGWLSLERPATESGEPAPFPPGFCHFPQYGEDFFKQLTAEHLVRIVNRRTRFVTMEWQVLPGRENHWLDTRVYNRAAANRAGLDRYAAGRKSQGAKPASAPAAPSVTSQAPEPRVTPAPAPRRESWLRGGRGAMGRSWIRR